MVGSKDNGAGTFGTSPLGMPYSSRNEIRRKGDREKQRTEI